MEQFTKISLDYFQNHKCTEEGKDYFSQLCMNSCCYLCNDLKPRGSKIIRIIKNRQKIHHGFDGKIAVRKNAK